ncbi:MAG TPA: hypothetical protein VJ910_11210 [Desulfuromonadales bacterium]|nr:hypothetical protein [Desulfuromonadales bacterium]
MYFPPGISASVRKNGGQPAAVSFGGMPFSEVASCGSSADHFSGEPEIFSIYVRIETETFISTSGRPKMTPAAPGTDTVSHILKYCIADEDFAKKVYQQVIAEGGRTVALPDGEVQLSEAEHRAFAERFSTEVEPTVWTSKRAKDWKD